MKKLTIKNLLSVMDEYSVIEIFKEGKLIYNSTGYPLSLENFVVGQYHLDIRYSSSTRTISPVMRIFIDEKFN